MKVIKRKNRIQRHKRIRAKISGNSAIPRVSIFRSNRNIFVQFIDDATGKTLVSSQIKSKENKKGKKIDVASSLGEALAKKAQEAGINKVVFDKGGYAYHGRVKAFADGLRKGGLKF